jgi:hypothetical protein
MATTTKKIYEAPSATLIELAHQGVICASMSASILNPMGDGDEEEWTF